MAASPSPPRPRRHVADSTFDQLVTRLNGSDLQSLPGVLRDLAALADSSPTDRGSVVTAVCAFLRSPWRSPASSVGATPRRSVPATEAGVRRQALEVVAERLRDPDADHTWCGFDLDLAGAVLAGADFSHCWFTGGRLRLEGAWCIEGVLSFAGVQVDGGTISLRHWNGGQGQVRLDAGDIRSGSIQLSGASLADGASLISARDVVVDGGTLSFVDLGLAAGTLDLSGVTVTAGALVLRDLRMSGGRLTMDGCRLVGGVTDLRGMDVSGGRVVVNPAQVTAEALDVRELQPRDNPAADALVRAASGSVHQI